MSTDPALRPAGAAIPGTPAATPGTRAAAPRAAATGPSAGVPTASPGSAAASDDRQVNAEAVQLEVRVARLGSRALALMVDIAAQAVLFVLTMALLLVSLALLPGDVVDDAFVETALRVVVVLVLLIYPTTMETLTNGRSLGKMVVGLRVVRDDGGPIRVRHALTRSLVGLAVEWPGLVMPLVTWVVSLTTMLCSTRGRRLGDLAAGTMVVHERSPATWKRVPPMPPELASWAAGLDLTAVDDDLALAVRHHLAREAAIREPHRTRLGHDLAAEVATRISTAVPYGTSQLSMLAAVVAERRRRAGRQLLAGRALTQRMWPGFGRLDRALLEAAPPAPDDDGQPAR